MSVKATSSRSRCSRVRKDVRDLSGAEWNRYVRAVKSLHTRRRSDEETTYDRFVQIHVDEQPAWHGGQYFLPSHRQMLWEFEDALRAIDPTVTVPYYDWTINFDRWTFDDVWNMVGGANGNEIPSAPFKGWTSLLPERHTVSRAMISNSTRNYDGDRVLPMESRAALDAQISDTRQSFESFSNFLEVTHGLFHVEVGGDMRSGMTSPSDPVFYLHHAFVDKVWRDWQLSGGDNKFDGFHDGVRVSRTHVLSPRDWGRTVDDVLGSLSECVKYQEASERPPRADGLRSGDNSASVVDRLIDIAKLKAYQGALYKQNVREAREAQDTFLKGASFSKLPTSILENALKSKVKAQARVVNVLPEDLQSPDRLLAMSVSDVEAEGKRQLKGLIALQKSS